MRTASKRARWCSALAGVLLISVVAVRAQGPFTAQIQALLRSANTWTGAQTFSSGITVSGSCTGCGSGGSVSSVAMTVPAFLSIAGSPVTTTGTLAVTLSGTALPVLNGGTGITAIGTGMATWWATPSSANLIATLTDETGTGAAVFANTPTLVTPILGVATHTSVTGPTVIGGTGTTSTLALRSTSGSGTTGADIIFQTGTNGATEVGRVSNAGLWGLGCTTAGNILDVCSNGGGPVFIHRYSADTGAASVVGFKARGTQASPGQVLNNDQIALFTARGYQTATGAFSTADVGRMGFFAAQDFTNANMATGFQLQVTPQNSTTVATVLSITSTAFTVTGAITPASTGTRYLCISTTGVITSSAAICSGT